MKKSDTRAYLGVDVDQIALFSRVSLQVKEVVKIIGADITSAAATGIAIAYSPCVRQGIFQEHAFVEGVPTRAITVPQKLVFS